MVSPFPDDMFGTAFQRFAYNIDLIEKRYAKKRPSGLELDVDTGKIIQVVDAKRPRLTAAEAKEKMRFSFLAPQSLLGNSSLCSPFVHDMTAPRETKLRVLKHNKRFKQQLDNGYDCSTFLTDENGNNNASAANDEENYEENREEEVLFDMDDILDDDTEEDGDEKEEEGVENELSEDEEENIGTSDEQELQAELDNERKNEEDLPFEEPEEASNEETSYKNLKITRALILRLTPKASRNASITSKTNTPSSSAVEETPKPTRGRKLVVASKEQDAASTPQLPKKIIKALCATIEKSTSKTDSASMIVKSPKRMSRKRVSSKDYDCYYYY